MNPFLRVIEALNAHDVRYVVVGGFAAVMHGHHRATRDLDLVVDLTQVEASKAIEALVSLGMTSRAPVDPREFVDAAHRDKWRKEKGAVVFTMIDAAHPMFAVLFTESPIEWQALYYRSLSVQLGNQPLRICSLDDLIAMKTACGRPQDVADVQILQRLRDAKHG